MVIFESFLSSRAFKRGLELPLLTELGRVCVVVLLVYATMKVVDLLDRGVFSMLFVPKFETYMYWLEIVGGVFAPIILLSQDKIRHSTKGLFASAVLVILGFIMNRMNITITGMEGWSGTSYIPSIWEFAVTMSIVAFGFVAFYYIAKYFPVFKEYHEEKKEMVHPDELWLHDIKSVSKAVVR
jgi:Ni/Fe-hydrogenase subunit HybB-like protein